MHTLQSIVLFLPPPDCRSPCGADGADETVPSPPPSRGGSADASGSAAPHRHLRRCLRRRTEAAGGEGSAVGSMLCLPLHPDVRCAL